MSSKALGSTSSRQMTPMTRSLVRIGTPSHEFDSSPILMDPRASASAACAERNG